MAPKYNLNQVTRPYPFMTCVVKVDAKSYGQRTVAKVLDKCHGVHSFRMDDNGVVEISGTVDPSVLLKMLGRAGKSAELCWFQFGECSNNLFMPTNLTGSGRSIFSQDGRYLQAANLSRPKLPSREALNHSYGYDGYDHHYNSYGNNHGYQLAYDDAQNQKQDYYHAHAHAHGYPYSFDDRHDSQQSYNQYQSGNRHGGNQTRSRSSGGDDIPCCTVM